MWYVGLDSGLAVAPGPESAAALKYFKVRVSNVRVFLEAESAAAGGHSTARVDMLDTPVRMSSRSTLHTCVVEPHRYFRT